MFASESLRGRAPARLFRATLARLRLFFRLENKILAIIASYSVAIGLFTLVTPLIVQELVSTFSFAVQPIMIVTLAATRLSALLVVAAFRVLQARAVVIRPQVLIFDGTLHSMHQATRDTILRRLCSKAEAWTVIFVSNDPALIPHVNRRVFLT